MGDIYQVRRSPQRGHQRGLIPSGHKMLAIVAPMTTELSGIRREVRDAEARGASLHVSGVGKDRVTASLNRIMDQAPDGVIMVGFCGATDPALKTGDLHVANLFHATDGGNIPSRAIAANESLTATLTDAAHANGRRIVTAPSATVPAVAGIVTKSAVYASLDAASVNMEDYWAACAARSVGVPFASVRAVLDTADQELPPWVSLYARNPRRAAWGLVTHPGRVPTLLHLRRQAELARRQLTRCLLAAVESLTAHQSSHMAVFR